MQWGTRATSCLTLFKHAGMYMLAFCPPAQTYSINTSSLVFMRVSSERFSSTVISRPTQILHTILLIAMVIKENLCNTIRLKCGEFPLSFVIVVGLCLF